MRAVTVSDLQVSVYELDVWKDTITVTLERCRQMSGPDLWAIRERGACLNKKGEWEFEPMPSSRTKSFFKRCRWSTAEEALSFWNRRGKSRFEHYRDKVSIPEAC